MTLASALYVGRVTHHRFRPRRHRLAYRTYWLLLDLDELPELPRHLRLLAYNRFNLFSVHDTDHGSGEQKALRTQIDAQLAAAGLDLAGGKILLLAMPRLLGYAFNPLSVYFCYGEDGGLKALIYQVHNTFKQRHSYVIAVVGSDAGAVQQHCAKRFYVSPFLDMEMRYDFRVEAPGEAVRVTVRGSDRDGDLIAATLFGRRQDLTDAQLVRVFFSHPLLTLKVTLAIHFEAILLWLKGLRLRPWPAAPERPVTVGESAGESDMNSNRTEAVRPSFRAEFRLSESLTDRLVARLLAPILNKLDKGLLSIDLPSGSRIEQRGQLPGPEATLSLKRWRALRRLAVGGDVGFAEGYMHGDWTTPDLKSLLDWSMLNEQGLERLSAGFSFARLADRFRHLSRANTRKGSRRNIESHYDLGNGFYAAWLDADMHYSSALYEKPTLSLEEAQEAKLDRIVDLLSVKPGDHVLEIGCGWGALAERLVTRHGVRLTGITLSREQCAYAQSRLAGNGTILLQDYRDVTGSFDAIVSIEMLEAAGEDYWSHFFEQLRTRLKPGGVAVLQVITIDETRFACYRQRPDFIQRYIFPGGMLPTASLIREQLAAAKLCLQSLELFGQSYALTLAEWRKRFLQAKPTQGGVWASAEFRRMWDYYLAYCEVGFQSRALDVGLYRITHRRP